jgi:hypothetical protein
MHQESFDMVSCRGLEEAQGELFNRAFHETQRSAGSAFAGVSFFQHAYNDFQEIVLNDIGCWGQFLFLGFKLACPVLFHCLVPVMNFTESA